MPSSPPGLLGIGPFARRSGLSIKTLRHYHRLGILLPAHVEPASGYRYYHPDQVDQVQDCRALALVGVPLRRVRELVRAGMTPRDFRQILLETQARVGERIRSDAARLSWLEGSLAAVSGEACAPETALVPVPGRLTLSARERLEHVSQGDALRDELARRWGPDPALRRELEAATVWHDCGRATGLVDCEAVLPVPAGPGSRSAGHGRLRNLRPCLAVRVRPTGPDGPVADAYLAGWRRLVSLGLPLVAPVREWVRYDGGLPRVTEVHFPVAPL